MLSVKKMVEELLKIKKSVKESRPRFIRSGATHIKRVSRSGYRKPKGVHNKVGNNKKGHRTTIKTGFGYPKKVRGLTEDGLTIVTVSSLQTIKSLDSKKIIIVLASSLGMKKRIALLELVKEQKLRVQGVKDINQYIQLCKDSVQKRKVEQSKKEKVRSQKKDEAVRAKAGKKGKADSANKSETVTEDTKVDKQSTEKKEQDKTLISKNQ